MIFSSQFPTLKEEKSGVFDNNSIANSSGYTSVYEHNLGYEPFFLVFDAQGQFVLGGDWGVDDKKIYASFNSGVTLVGKYRWVIYRLKLFEDYEAPALKVQFAPEGGSDDKFVVKVSKKGKDITSADLRDYTIHSRARSPLIHKVSVKNWINTTDVFEIAYHKVDPGLPYNPIAFGFSKDPDIFNHSPITFNLISGGQDAPELSRSAATRQIIIKSAISSSIQTSIVIFKDPILAPTVVKVAY